MLRKLGYLLLLVPLLALGEVGAVRPGVPVQLPKDAGSHPDFNIEWWYVTGWLYDTKNNPYGFQVTFFRLRNKEADQVASRFAPRQMLAAHVALSDPQRGRLLHDGRVARTGFGLAGAHKGGTWVWLRDWRLSAQGGVYEAQVAAKDFRLRLRMSPTQPPLLNGQQGYSRKGGNAASYYYSQPHLAIQGTLSVFGQSINVRGRGWLDHEWSDGYMPENAIGWDWVGLNLKEGGALMAFQMRDRTGKALWSAATLRRPNGTTMTYSPQEVRFTPQQHWQSPTTGTRYPVVWRITVGGDQWEVRPLMLAQEQDARQTTGTIYWEGAVTVWQNNQQVGEGYLELTGYGEALRMGATTSRGR